MGAVLKAASDNGHSNVGSLLAHAGYPHARVFNLALDMHQMLPGLARVLGVAEAELKALLHPVVSASRAVRTVAFLGAEIPDYDIVSRRRRISMETLNAEPFHRALWNHGLLPYCPHSLEKLLDRCATCGGSLGWFRAEGLATCGSSKCDADLGGRPTERLPPALAPAYQRMAALAAPRDAAVRVTLHEDLTDLDTGIVFELGWRLASVIDGIETPRKAAQTLPPERIARTLATADRILTGWPTSLHEELRPLLLTEGAEKMKTRLRKLRSATSKAAGWPMITQVVRQSHPDLMAKGRHALRALDGTIMTGTSANRIVAMAPHRFAVVKRSRELTALTISGNERVFSDFGRKDVIEFARAKADSMPLRVAAERLGIAQHGVEQLAAMGMVDVEAHPALRAFSPCLRLTTSSVELLLTRLAEAGTVELADAVPIRSAVKAIPGEKPWGPIVAAMLDGTISFVMEAGSRRAFHRVGIAQSSADMLSTFRFERADHPGFDFAPDMTRRDVEEALNLVPRRLAEALREEIGSADVRRPLVADVQRIARERISLAEICARTALGSRRTPMALKGAGLPRLGAAGWSRRDVERLL